MSFRDGQTVNQRYQICGKLSKGGFGTVYLAFDSAEQRMVAIKESNATDADEQNALLEEINLLMRLRHPRLPRIYKFFQSDEQRFCIVMEYILGENLENLYRRGLLPGMEVAVDWIIQLLEGLEELHEQSPPIIHRDVKLGNIQVHAATGQIYLLDLGIAKSGPHTHILAATAPFSPPEQYGRAGTTPASDVYSVGVVLYILLTGQEPPSGPERATKPLVPPRDWAAAIPDALEQVILKALDPAPERRYADARAMREAVLQVGPLGYVAEIKRLEAQVAMLSRRLDELAREATVKRPRLDNGKRFVIGRKRHTFNVVKRVRAGKQQAMQVDQKALIVPRSNEESFTKMQYVRDKDEYYPMLGYWHRSVIYNILEDPFMNRFGKGILIFTIAGIFFIILSSDNIARNAQVVGLIWGVYPMILIILSRCRNAIKRGFMLKINISLIYPISVIMYILLVNVFSLGFGYLFYLISHDTIYYYDPLSMFRASFLILAITGILLVFATFVSDRSEIDNRN